MEALQSAFVESSLPDGRPIPRSMSCVAQKHVIATEFIVPRSPDMSADKADRAEEGDVQSAEIPTHPVVSADDGQDTAARGAAGAVAANVEHAVPIPAGHAPAVYYSPPGSPPPHMPIYMGGMMHYGNYGNYGNYYHPSGSPPGLYPPHVVHYMPHPSMGMAQGSPPMYHHQYYPELADVRVPDPSSFQRAHSNGSTASLEGSSPTKRGEGRATGRISRSSRTMSATQLQDDLNFDPEASVDSLRGRTTLMVRNLPNKYVAQDMIKLLKSVGLEATFDFLYVPLDFRNSAGLGYCFINMVEERDTLALYEAFAGKRWDEKGSKKVCEIKWARLQGKERLVAHFKEAKFPSREQRFLPLVWSTRRTVSGREVVDGEPQTIFEYVERTRTKLACKD